MSEDLRLWREELARQAADRGLAITWEDDRGGRIAEGDREMVFHLPLAGEGKDAGADRRAWVTSWLDGVVAGWSPFAVEAEAGFADVAGVLVPRLDLKSFVDGFAAARGERPFVQAWFDGLLLTYWLELEIGSVVLTDAVVQRWGVTADRITCGARSILFHRTQGGAEEHTPTIGRYAQGDGYDAGRVAIIEDHQWGLSTHGLWVGIPSRDLLLFAAPSDEGALRAFGEITRQAFAETASPRSPAVFRVMNGHVEQVDALQETHSAS